MRKRIAIVLSGLAAVTGAFPVASAAAGVEERVADGYIVVFDRSTANVARETEERERSGGFKSRLRFQRALKGFSATLSPGQVRRLRADPDVAYVAPDRIVRADASEPIVTGDKAPFGVRRIDAATDKGASVRQASTVGVAVLDTGVDLAHPDLNAVEGTNCVTPGASAQDLDGHGTHVAGTIAARNDGSGVTGVSPGTRIHAVKVLEQNSGTASQVICGIDWVTSNAEALGIKVVNMSLASFGLNLRSCDTTTDPKHQAICASTAAGITYVAAAGNSNFVFDDPVQPVTPAAYPEVLTATAMGDTDGQGGSFGPVVRCGPSWAPEEYDGRPYSRSNYAGTEGGAAHVVSAPGVCVESTYPGGGYALLTGTSMAAPHIAGAVALCFGEAGASGPCTGLTPAQVTQRVRADAQAATTTVPGYGYEGDPTRPVTGRFYGYLAWAGIPGSTPTTPIAPADYSLAVTPASVSVRAGRGVSATVKVTTRGGFSDPVTLSATGLPAGTSASFSPTSTTTSSTVTISTSRTSPKGTYTVRIIGLAAGLTRSSTLTLVIT